MDFQNPILKRKTNVGICLLIVFALAVAGCTGTPTSQPTQVPSATQAAPTDTPAAEIIQPTNTEEAPATEPTSIPSAPVAEFALSPMNTVTSPVNIEFIIDASGRMNELVDGQLKMNIVNEVLAKVIEDLPENVQVGIRVVYGKAPGGGETAKEGGCKEFALLSPMAQPDKLDLATKIKTIVPGDWSPLALTILSSIDDFDDQANNALIIIAASGDTCNGDPVRAARTLHESQLGVAAHVIGVNIDNETTRLQLESVAGQGGGIYTNATTSQELADALVGTINTIGQAPQQAQAQAPTATSTPIIISQSTPTPIPPVSNPINEASPTPIRIWGTPPAGGVTCQAVVINNAHVRSGPDRAFSIIDTLPKGTTVTLVGRNWYTSWLAFYTSNNTLGWIATFLLDVNLSQCNLPQLKEPAVPTEKPTKPYP